MALACAIAAMLAATSVHAGPPYATDDAGPIEAGVLEAIAYGQATRVSGETDTTLGLDLSYAVAHDVQVTAIVPHHHHAIAGAANVSGFGDVELGVKYRALGQKENSWLPSVAVHTVVRLPTAERDFGSGKTGATTTVWLQRDFGPWSAFGGRRSSNSVTVLQQCNAAASFWPDRTSLRLNQANETANSTTAVSVGRIFKAKHCCGTLASLRRKYKSLLRNLSE